MKTYHFVYEDHNLNCHHFQTVADDQDLAWTIFNHDVPDIPASNVRFAFVIPTNTEFAVTYQN